MIAVRIASATLPPRGAKATPSASTMMIATLRRVRTEEILRADATRLLAGHHHDAEDHRRDVDQQRQRRQRAAAAPAASGRSSRLRSAKRATPQIAIEKTTVTPTPATTEAITVSSSSLVSTIDRHAQLDRHRRALPRAPGEEDATISDSDISGDQHRARARRRRRSRVTP